MSLTLFLFRVRGADIWLGVTSGFSKMIFRAGFLHQRQPLYFAGDDVPFYVQQHLVLMIAELAISLVSTDAFVKKRKTRKRCLEAHTAVKPPR